MLALPAAKSCSVRESLAWFLSGRGMGERGVVSGDGVWSNWWAICSSVRHLSDVWWNGRWLVN